MNTVQIILVSLYSIVWNFMQNTVKTNIYCIIVKIVLWRIERRGIEMDSRTPWL